jgi:hypothetical protein
MVLIATKLNYGVYFDVRRPVGKPRERWVDVWR